MPEYIVFVMPPKDEDAEPFDIPEWSYDDAVATAKRYREHGWKACVIDYGTPFVLWRAKRLDGDAISVLARTCDEACIRARAVSEDYTSFQKED